MEGNFKNLYYQLKNLLPKILSHSTFVSDFQRGEGDQLLHFFKWIYSFGLIVNYNSDEPDPEMIKEINQIIFTRDNWKLEAHDDFEHFWDLCIESLLVSIEDDYEHFEVEVDFYKWPGIPWKRSALEFIFQFFQKTCSRDSDFESWLTETDENLRQAQSVMGTFDDEVPQGIPHSHWWWWDESSEYRKSMKGKVKKEERSRVCQKRNRDVAVESPFLLE